MHKKILLIHSGNETFVQLDREILGISYDVRELYAAHKFPAGFADYFCGIKDSDVLFCWFASWNSFWALLIGKLFRKPSILVIGGYDVANLPPTPGK